MNSEKKIVIKCWNCKKKFTILSEANSSIIIYRVYRGLEPSANEPPTKKKRLLKTCPYCSKENLIEI